MRKILSEEIFKRRDIDRKEKGWGRHKKKNP